MIYTFRKCGRKLTTRKIINVCFLWRIWRNLLIRSSYDHLCEGLSFMLRALHSTMFTWEQDSKEFSRKIESNADITPKWLKRRWGIEQIRQWKFWSQFLFKLCTMLILPQASVKYPPSSREFVNPTRVYIYLLQIKNI